MLADSERVNSLLDFYASLLTAKRLDIMNMYYRLDLSLGEIAANLQISRSAVYDQLRRTKDQLEDYETKLHLAALYQERIKIYHELEKIDDSKTSELTKRLRELE